jgi:tRNA pseudouridine38-40 synthase
LKEEDDLVRKRQWRVGPEQVELLRAAANRFEGTHNFHNFTVGRDFKDRSNQRHMKSIEVTVSSLLTAPRLYLYKVSDPVIHGETEWISVLFHGQSFMMHQV